MKPKTGSLRRSILYWQISDHNDHTKKERRHKWPLTGVRVESPVQILHYYSISFFLFYNTLIIILWNFMPINTTTKWTDFLKGTNYQSTLKKKWITWIFWCIFSF